MLEFWEIQEVLSLAGHLPPVCQMKKLPDECSLFVVAPCFEWCPAGAPCTVQSKPHTAHTPSGSSAGGRSIPGSLYGCRLKTVSLLCALLCARALELGQYAVCHCIAGVCSPALAITAFGLLEAGSIWHTAAVQVRYQIRPLRWLALRSFFPTPVPRALAVLSLTWMSSASLQKTRRRIWELRQVQDGA